MCFEIKLKLYDCAGQRYIFMIFLVYKIQRRSNKRKGWFILKNIYIPSCYHLWLSWLFSLWLNNYKNNVISFQKSAIFTQAKSIPFIWYINAAPLQQFKTATGVIFACLEFSSHSRIFHSYGDVIIAGEGVQTLTYDRHSCH